MTLNDIPRNEDEMLFTMFSAEGVRADLKNITAKGGWEVIIDLGDDVYTFVVSKLGDYHIAYSSAAGVRDLNEYELRCVTRLIEEFRRAYPNVA